MFLFNDLYVSGLLKKRKEKKKKKLKNLTKRKLESIANFPQGNNAISKQEAKTDLTVIYEGKVAVLKY